MIRASGRKSIKRNRKRFVQISLDKLSRIGVSEKFHWINFRELPFLKTFARQTFAKKAPIKVYNNQHNQKKPKKTNLFDGKEKINKKK